MPKFPYLRLLLIIFLGFILTSTQWFMSRTSVSSAQIVEMNNFVLYLPFVTNHADNTWQWEEPQFLTLTPTPDANDPFLMAIDANGQPHLWYNTYTAPRFIYHTTLTAQGWLTPTQIADTLGTSYTLFPPVQDAEGNFHLLWRNWLGSGVTNPYRLMYARYTGGLWTPEEEVYRTSDQQQGMVRVNPAGEVHVTSAGGIFSTIAQHFVRTPSGWTAPENITPSHNIYWVWPDILGGVQFYGESYDQTTFYHTAWLNGAQHTDVLPGIGDYLLWKDTQLDGENNLHIFERTQVPIPGGTVYGITHRCLTHDLLWTDEQVLSGETDTASPLVKAEDGYGKIALAWQESTGNLVHIAVFKDCTLAKTAQVTLPLDKSWTLEASALGQTPSAFCLLARRMYASTEYLVQCATYTP